MVVAIVTTATIIAGIFKALTMNKVLCKTLFHKPASFTYSDSVTIVIPILKKIKKKKGN